MNYKLLGVGSLLFLGFLVYSEASLFKLTNFICEEYNKSWVEIHYCRLKAYSRNKTSLHLNLTVSEPANNILVHAKIMKRANGYKPFLYDFTFDACEFMRKRNHPVTKIVWNVIRNVSTINHTCPFVGLQMVSDLYRIDLPIKLPSGQYALFVNWFFDRKLQFATNTYFSFKDDL